ncbi:hypothetical protein HELRODRAFT_167040 [Helobdella robusta]|uniref:Uncharacterized protein n=1 Tax=Helobdella robusta TaxID=6412 RepID=T1EYX8_HELRO|nr:hypothetical protein HELRODRAFT_167040 [Helobdella robusta]ESO10540.1 hypothetical protein HELRODRAFT_167040 [Helobdella robusta]
MVALARISFLTMSAFPIICSFFLSSSCKNIDRPPIPSYSPAKLRGHHHHHHPHRQQRQQLQPHQTLRKDEETIFFKQVNRAERNERQGEKDSHKRIEKRQYDDDADLQQLPRFEKENFQQHRDYPHRHHHNHHPQDVIIINNNSNNHNNYIINSKHNSDNTDYNSYDDQAEYKTSKDVSSLVPCVAGSRSSVWFKLKGSPVNNEEDIDVNNFETSLKNTTDFGSLFVQNPTKSTNKNKNSTKKRTRRGASSTDRHGPLRTKKLNTIYVNKNQVSDTECTFKKKLRVLGDGYFPTRVLTGECGKSHCHHGISNCVPKKYRVPVMKKIGRFCGAIEEKERLRKVVYEEAWKSIYMEVIVACQCDFNREQIFPSSKSLEIFLLKQQL